MKTLKIFSFMLASCSTLFAAESYLETRSDRPSLGLQAGVNFDSARTPSDIRTENYTGFTVGVNLDIPLSTAFSIQPELNYSRRGLNLINTGGARASVYYHSIELPVFAKVSFGTAVRPYLFAGPMATWNVSREVQAAIGGAATGVSFNPKQFDVSAVVGAGVEVGAFFANLRYVAGLLDIEEQSADWQARGFKILAGVKL